MRVLYIGQQWKGSTCLERVKVLKKKGWDVVEFDITDYYQSGSYFIHRIQHRYLNGPDVVRFNRDVLKFIEQQPNFNLIWIDKGRWVFSSTLETIKKITKSLLIHYTPDPAFTFHYSRHFFNGLPHYDLCITTKRYELKNYINSGAKNVMFTLQGIGDTFVNCDQCSNIKNKNRNGVVFIGHRETHYENVLLDLAKFNKPLNVWGPGWEKLKTKKNPLSKYIRGGGVWHLEYPQKLASGRIGIGLLSKYCPDQFTTRSFEVPASGTMLLAERTNEHLELFKEGIEAEFFSNINELDEKIEFYLNNQNKCLEIAQKGRNKTMNYYTWDHVLKPAIDTIYHLLGRM